MWSGDRDWSEVGTRERMPGFPAPREPAERPGGVPGGSAGAACDSLRSGSWPPQLRRTSRCCSQPQSVAVRYGGRGRMRLGSGTQAQASGPSQQGATCVDLGVVQPTGAETRRPGSSPSPSPLEGPLFLHPSLPSPSVHAGRRCCSCGPASPAAIAGRRPGAACGAVGGTECRRLRDAGVLAFPG